MGAGIAAHLANVGIPVLLLDIVPPDAAESKDKAARNRIAQTGLEKALKAKPASAFYTAKSARLVTVGNTEDDWDKLGEVDLDRRGGDRAAGRQARHLRAARAGAQARRHRHLEHVGPPGGADAGRGTRRRLPAPLPHHPLLQPRALPEAAGAGRRAADRPGADALHGPVRDREAGQGRRLLPRTRPTSSATASAPTASWSTLHRMLDEGYTIEEVDAILGPVMGRPRSAAFRTADLAGLDTFAHVADNLYENLPDDPAARALPLPDFVRRWSSAAGSATRPGRASTRACEATRASEILALDPATLEYRPRAVRHFASIDAVKRNPDVFERIRGARQRDDRAGKLAWELTADTLLYTAATTPRDRRRHRQHRPRDALGLQLGGRPLRDVGRARRRGDGEAHDRRRAHAAAARRRKSWATAPGASTPTEPQRSYWDFNTHAYAPVPPTGPTLSLAALHKGEKVVKSNGSASLIDMGDGVLCVEFHAKMNAIDDDITAMLARGRRGGQEELARHRGRQRGARFLRRRQPLPRPDGREVRRVGRRLIKARSALQQAQSWRSSTATRRSSSRQPDARSAAARRSSCTGRRCARRSRRTSASSRSARASSRRAAAAKSCWRAGSR